jgi:TAT (twin-arginine translocation) pathway signal sequence
MSIKRRSFVKTSVAAGAATVVPNLLTAIAARAETETPALA